MMAATQGTDGAMASAAQLYEDDFFLWTQEQEGLLGRVRREDVELPIDWPHVAEEIGAMGRRDRREVNGHLCTIFEHLLKLEHSPGADARLGWIETVMQCRDDAEHILDDSPSLRNSLAERLQKEYQFARGIALAYLSNESVTAKDVPLAPAYTINEALDPDWWPKNRHGHET